MKILSINLWFDKYGQKTLAELSSFAYYGYETYAATFAVQNGGLILYVYKINGHDKEVIHTKEFNKLPKPLLYSSGFSYLFKYAEDNDYNIVYMRRLMSKLMYAFPYFKRLSAKCKIVYEIPTYPFDVPANKLYAIRDKLELSTLKSASKYISVISACVYQHAKAPDSWLLFENGLDIANFTVKEKAPLTDTVNFLMIANMAAWHRSERILYAIKNYSGKYKIKLIVASPSSKEYEDMKALAAELGIKDNVDFYDYMPLSEINKIANMCHIAVGQLSGSEYGVMETHALKHKDYCALGLPIFSTCTDSSYPDDYPYYYFLKDTDADISLEEIISWFEGIYPDENYRSKMYEYAKENLQFHGYVNDILTRIK